MQSQALIVEGAGGWLAPLDSSRGSTSNVPITTGAATSADRNSEGPRSYPDHAVLNMTKDQLKAAPAFKFSR